jgi:NADH-quinone oxidoreductase subunit L
MSNLELILVLIPSLPLAATLITAVFGKPLLGSRAHLPIVLALIGSFVLSATLLFSVSAASKDEAAYPHGWEMTVDLWRWLKVDSAIATPDAARPAVPPAVAKAEAADKNADGADAAADKLAAELASGVLPARLPFIVDVTLRADPLTCIMLTMVTFIASLVAIYASGYMHGDPGYPRFFTYIALFVFSMTMLVSVSNFVLLFVFWEAVGLCSYLLVGFWYEKPEAAAAGKKAFLVNRVGDFAFVLGMLTIWITYGSLNFHDANGVAGILGQTRLADPTSYVGGSVATAICVLLMLGACGKSAQLPLHVWLPDAMEGPTPVSALIHAATMVTAGVYMVTRCTPLYWQSPSAQEFVAIIGASTAAMAGFIAITQTDLKRVLAYSTISQLGYMFLGLGVGTLSGITAGMFHLFTHAFFKALLFLGAGSVMHAMGGVIDMRHFSGLRRLMPRTCWTFLFGCLALAGVVPFAGFWSKDAIMAAVHERAHDVAVYTPLYYIGLATAFATAMYTFRAFFLTFYGPERIPREAGHHAHESPPAMTVPLMVLAVCALVVGAYFELTHGFANFLGRTPSLSFEALQETWPHDHRGMHFDVAAVSTVIALAGIGLAAYLYLGGAGQVEWLTNRMRPLYQLSLGKLFIDQIYAVLFVWPLRLLAWFSYQFDRWIIDGLVNLCGKIPVLFGAALRNLQTGMVQFYALAMVLGVLVLIGTLLIWPTG